MRHLFYAPYLECSNLDFWNSFRENRINTADIYKLADQLAYDTSLLEIWQTGAPFLDDLCNFPKYSGTHYCHFGLVHALTFAALRYRDQELAKYVTSLFAQHSSLNFMDDTGWPLRWADLKLFEEGIWEMADDYMKRVIIVPAISPPSVFNGEETKQDPIRRSIVVTAVGTHPTLTLEPITSMGMVVHVSSSRVYGLSYKCDLFPELCNLHDDELVPMLGGVYRDVTNARLGSTDIEEFLDVDRIGAFLESRARDADIFLCTSPFLLCAIGSHVSSTPMIAYLGLPTM